MWQESSVSELNAHKTGISKKQHKTSALSREQALMQGIFNLGYGVSATHNLSWMEDALCAQTDPDIFYPEKGGSTAPATSICKGCAVRSECLEYAITNDIRHGIWGGTSDNDRKRISRERKLAQGGHR